MLSPTLYSMHHPPFTPSTPFYMLCHATALSTPSVVAQRGGKKKVQTKNQPYSVSLGTRCRGILAKLKQINQCCVLNGKQQICYDIQWHDSNSKII